MRLTVTVFASLVAVLGASAEKPAGKGPAGYAWEASYEQARLKAAVEGKLLFVDFYTDS